MELTQHTIVWWQQACKHLATSVLMAVSLSACTTRNTPTIYLESNKNLVGLASFYQMKGSVDTMLLSDFFIHPELIDSIHFGQDKPMPAGNKLPLTWNTSTALQTVDFFSGDTIFSVAVKKSVKKPVSITYTPTKNDTLIQAKGEFNNWNPQASKFKPNGQGVTYKLWLSPGQYQYVLVVNGREMPDPANPTKVSNGMGGFNSLISLTDSSATPLLRTQHANQQTLTITAINTQKIVALWQNQLISVSPVPHSNQQYKLTIPKAAAQMQRSYIRVIACGKSKISNDLLIPLQLGKVLNSPTQLTRTDREAAILYFMMVDRFKDGNPTNNRSLDVPEVLPKADFYGGDIAGVTQKIKDGYFDSLHVSTIWLSPIIKNPEGMYGQYPNPQTKFSAYHGYWPVSFNQIDSRFGTPKELHELVETAHQKGMNVLLDFVANHVHKEHPVYKQHPEWATNLYLPDGSLNTERWDDHRLTTWFDVFLPTLDLSKPEITEMLTDSAVYWINEYNLDGFRHDATKHIPEYFWRTLTQKLKKQVIVPQNKVLYQIGETYGSRELIASYINSGELDGQFDFNLFDAALAVFADSATSMATLQTALLETQKYYGSHHLMGNISGNQDKPRFMALADGSIRFDEDSKLAGWTRNITVQDTLAYTKLATFMAFNLTIPGVPVIYYGDEIGMTGGNDPDNRRMMRFNQLSEHEQALKKQISALASLRKSNLPLIYGDLEILQTTDSTLVFTRSYFGTKTMVCLSKSGAEASITLPTNNPWQEVGGKKFIPINEKITIKIPPYGYKILTNE